MYTYLLKLQNKISLCGVFNMYTNCVSAIQLKDETSKLQTYIMIELYKKKR